MPAPATILADAEAVAAAIAGRIAGVALARPAVGILLAGELPARACALLARDHAAALAGVHVWSADERTVAVSHPDSTHGALGRAGLDRTAAITHRIEGELGAIEASRRATAALRAHAGEDPELDLAVLVLGADGHAAALYPGDPALAATGAYFPARGGTRITATIPLLVRARRLVLVATGAGVAPVLGRILRAPPSPERPASLIAAAAAEVTWLVDAAAYCARVRPTR